MSSPIPTVATSGRSSPRRTRRRWFAVGSAIALHLAILALFLRSHPPIAVGAGEGRGTMDVSLAGLSLGAAPSPVSAAPTTPVPPAKSTPPAPVDPIKPRSVLAIVSDILAVPLPEHAMTPTPLSPVIVQAIALGSGAPGAACDIGGAVQTALRADPATHAAVMLIPTRSRTAANAILLWNGQWVAPTEVGGTNSFDTLRLSIRQIVAAAEPECREREIVGPRFMLVPDSDATMVVVFGDASWRWSDLLVDQAAQARFRPDTKLFK